MATYILDSDGQPVRVNRIDIRQRYPNVSFPENPSPESLANFNIYILQETTEPSYDPATQKIVEVDPVETSPGVWTQTFDVVTLDAGELQEYQESISESTALQALKNDNQAKALLKASPDEINSWIDSNVTNLTEAKNVLQILARVSSVLAQEVLRD